MVKKRMVVVEIPAPEDHFNWGWIIWFLISAGGFAILESHAIRTGRHDRTLSCHLRRITGIYPMRPWHHIGRTITVLGLAGFCSWFAHHIAFSPRDDPRFRLEIAHDDSTGLG